MKFLQRLVLLGSVTALSPSLACSVAVDSGRVQCSQTSDCTGRGGAFLASTCFEHVCQVATAPTDPSWSCVGTSRVSPHPGPYAVTVPGAADVVTQQPLAAPTVSLCRKLDVGCSNPVSTRIVDSAAGATFSVDAAFSGYLQVTADGYVSSLYFFNPPVDRDLTTAMIPIATQATYATLMSAIGLSPSSDRGTVVLEAWDCAGKPAAGVSFSSSNVDAQTKIYYLAGGLPSVSATATDSWGYGGMGNIPAGAVIVNAHLASPSATLSTVSIIVRPMSITFTEIVPYAS